MRFIHLNAVYGKPNSIGFLNAPVAVRVDHIVVVTQGSPSMVTALGYECGSVLRLAHMHDDIAVTEDAATVLKLIRATEPGEFSDDDA